MASPEGWTQLQAPAGSTVPVRQVVWRWPPLRPRERLPAHNALTSTRVVYRPGSPLRRPTWTSDIGDRPSSRFGTHVPCARDNPATRMLRKGRLLEFERERVNEAPP